VGAEAAAKTAADGYTLVLVAPSLAISPRPLLEAQLRPA